MSFQKKKENSGHVFDLHESWEGVNEIDIDRLVGPDVTKGARALAITASSWLNGLVDKQTIISSHFEDYELLFSALNGCQKVVPGFEKRGQTCNDCISDDMRKAFEEMKNYKRKNET